MRALSRPAPFQITSHENARALARFGKVGRLSLSVLEQLAPPVALMDPEGRLLLVTDSAARLAARYSAQPVTSGDALPGWMAAALRAAVTSSPYPATDVGHEAPLRFRGPAGELLVRIVRPSPDGWAAVFEERAVQRAAGTSVTCRESEVLGLVAAGPPIRRSQLP